MFTRQHFNAIAAVPLPAEAHAALADLFQADNPKFNRELYLAAAVYAPTARPARGAGTPEIVPLTQRSYRFDRYTYRFRDYIVWDPDVLGAIHIVQDPNDLIHPDGAHVPIFLSGSQVNRRFTTPALAACSRYFYLFDLLDRAEIVYPYEENPA